MMCDREKHFVATKADSKGSPRIGGFGEKEGLLKKPFFW